MFILVEPSDYSPLNTGDMAMLEVGLRRLRALWPHADIRVFFDDRYPLPIDDSGASSLTLRGRHCWFTHPLMPWRLHNKLLPVKIAQHLFELERKCRRHYPSAAKLVLRSKLRLRRKSNKDLDDFLHVVERADLLVVTGMGGITDFFSEFAFGVLDLLELAIGWGVTTAMFGQGVGPIEDSELKKRAGEVLPRVDLIALREERAGWPLLSSLGVRREKVITTGDDAIELAYSSRPEGLGAGLGINIRAADYSAVSSCLVEAVRPVLQRFALERGAKLVAVPISHHATEMDAFVIRQLMRGYPDLLDDAESLKTAARVIERVSHCRVVITGSYHAGVFALSQGIPVVGLANSRYYADKFFGLAEQFGTGCKVVFLSDEDFTEKLVCALDEAWKIAEQVRPELLSAAERQIESGWVAYRKVYELVENRKTERRA